MLPAAAASTDGEVQPGQPVAGLAGSSSVLNCQQDQLLCT